MTKYDRPITDENFDKAESYAIKIHEKTARKREQGRIIRHVGVYAVTLTLLVAVYAVLRFLRVGSNLFGEYDVLVPLNAFCDAVFSPVLNLSELWYVRWPLFAFEAIMIPVAVAGLTALCTCRRPAPSPNVHGRSNREKAMVLRDIIISQKGFVKEAIISGVICTFAWIVFSAVETIFDYSRGSTVFVIGPGEAGVLHFLLITLCVIAAAIALSLISFAFSSVFYRIDRREATLMMSDLFDYIAASKEENSGADEKKNGADELSAVSENETQSSD